jgi:hypothetical protein
MLTSDGSVKDYPNNKTSKFKILLKEPLELGDDEWEVCLRSINYPFSWTNVGPSAKVYMKFYSSLSAGVQEMNFPDWQCTSMEEVVKFIANEVRQKADDRGSSQIMFELDDLGRVRIENRGRGYYDLGFSDNMLKLLGLAGSPEAEYLRMQNFEARQKIRDTLNSIWIDGFRFDYGDDFVREGVQISNSEEEFLEVVKSYLNVEKMTWFYHNHGMEIEAMAGDRPGEYSSKSIMLTPGKVVGRVTEAFLKLPTGFVNDGSGKIVPRQPEPEIITMRSQEEAEFRGPEPPPALESPLASGRTLLASYRRSIHYLMTLMKKLYSKESLPKVINASTPGVLNPVQRMFVYVNIIDPIDVNDRFVRLLKLVNTAGESFKTTQEDFLQPMYHTVQKGKISMIDVLIADESGDPVSFQIGTVILTLHFRKVLPQRR